MDIKLIALDLDGTTLRTGSILSEETKKTLEAAIAKGVHVVIATGRGLDAIPQNVFTIEGLEYIITSNGAYVIRLEDMKTLYSNFPSGDVIEKVHDFLWANKEHPIEVFTEGKAYVDEHIYNDVKANGSDFMDAAYIVKTRRPVPSAYDFLLEHKHDIENINIHFKSLEEKLQIKGELEKIDGITLTSSYGNNLEIGGQTTSKADAIAHLCSLLGIDEKYVMAVGDNPNDSAMIEAAGLGIAVGNAVDEVKAIADYVTLSNNEDGVAHAVKKFVLGAI